MGVEGIGASVVRKEDRRFITGKGRYVDDIKLVGMSFAHFVRSPHAHAKVKSIDASAALKKPGVVAVLTGKQIVDDKVGNLICGWAITSKDGSPMKMGAWPAMAPDTVRFNRTQLTALPVVSSQTGAPVPLGTLAAFGSYAVGFVARPLGGAVFGHYGDKLGRKAMLTLTMIIMGAGTYQEISEQLGRKLQPVVASVVRPNLFYEVETLADKEQKMRRLLEICKEENGPGVVYARSREACEQLAATLRRAGVQAAHYHAGMSSEERSSVQERFMLDRVRVIVATIAFGMGIDKSNVRLIVHFSPPDSLEGYVQESGRAGRDGRPSRCVLFMTSGDKSNLSRWKRQGQLKLEELRAIYKIAHHGVAALHCRS